MKDIPQRNKIHLHSNVYVCQCAHSKLFSRETSFGMITIKRFSNQILVCRSMSLSNIQRCPPDCAICFCTVFNEWVVITFSSCQHFSCRYFLAWWAVKQPVMQLLFLLENEHHRAILVGIRYVVSTVPPGIHRWNTETK